MKLLLTLLCLLVLTSGIALATTRYVTPSGTGDYQTINAAISASSSGDTVLIGPGNYGESTTIYGEVHVIGAGWDVVSSSRLTLSGPKASVEGMTLQGGYNCITLNAGADSVQIRRCRLVSTNGTNKAIRIVAGATSILIQDCLLQKTSNGDLIDASGDEIIIRNCIFSHEYGSNHENYNAITGANNILEVYNCVFLNYTRILWLTGLTPAVFMNNIAYDWGSGAEMDWGIYFTGTVFDYNGASDTAPPGSNATLLPDNPFVNYDEALNYEYGISDLRLTPGTPAIDAGHPLILDLDATTSDLGVYGGPIPIIDNGVPGYPFVLDMNVDPNSITIGEDINITSTGRVGPSY